MATRSNEAVSVTEESGNVFADLGVAEPAEELAKAQVAGHIRQTIKRRRLTQAAAAQVMGLDQPKVSALMNERLAGFSSDRLLRCLTALGQDVEIVLKAKPRHRERGQIRVVEEAAWYTPKARTLARTARPNGSCRHGSGGEGGIRTHGGSTPHRFSRAAPSTTRTPLRAEV